MCFKLKIPEPPALSMPNNHAPFLSLIIPVYGVEAWIRSCMLSLIRQDLPPDQYEIIVVVDGSPDASFDVARKTAQEYPEHSIRIFEKKNGGVSSARNYGLSFASGQYVMFIDGDDRLQENALGSIKVWVNRLECRPYVVHFNIINENDAGTADVTRLQETAHGVCVHGPEYYLQFRHNGNTRDTSCTSLFHRSFLERFELQYNEKASFIEDGEFLAKVFSMAGPCAGNLFPVYLRTLRPDSATASGISVKPEVIQGAFASALSLFRFKQKHSPEGLAETVLNQALIKFVSLTLQLCLNTNRYSEARNYMQKFKRECIIRLDTSGVTMNFPELGKAYNRGLVVFTLYHFTKNYRKRLNNLGKMINLKY